MTDYTSSSPGIASAEALLMKARTWRIGENVGIVILRTLFCETLVGKQQTDSNAGSGNGASLRVTFRFETADR